MLKKLIVTSLCVCLFLTACTPAAQQATHRSTGSSPNSTASTSSHNNSATPALSSCTYITSPTATVDPSATSSSLYPEVSTSDWVSGASTSTVTVIYYLDFQCSTCASLFTILNKLVRENPNELRMAFRYYPDSSDDKALISAQAAEAAGLHGKFWEMASLLFANQQTWAKMNSTDFQSWAIDQAKSLGLDASQFSADMLSDAVKKKLNDETTQTASIGIPYTPFMLINGDIYQGSQDEKSLSTVIKLLLLEKMQITGCPPTVIDTQKTYLADLRTTKGDIVIQLYASEAPIAVNNFVFLAKRGWYDGVTFHRVIAGAIAQAGDPSGTGYGGPGYAFKNEISAHLNFDEAGMVGMANAGADSNGSQFFITLSPQTALDGSYTVFGKVVQGLSVAQSLTPRDPSQTGTLPDGDKILSATIEEK